MKDNDDDDDVACTITATIMMLKNWGVKRIKILSAIASEAGIRELQRVHPDVEVIVAAIDPTLNEVI